MSLTFQKSSNGATYVSIKESFWDPVRKKYSSRTVKNFGRLDRLLQEDPQILEKLEAEAKHYKQLNNEKKQQAHKQRLTAQVVSSTKAINENRDNRIMMAGSCVYHQLWNLLDLQRKLKDLTQRKTIDFNFADAVFSITCARALMPEAKLSQWKKRNQFLYSAPELQLKDLYHSSLLLSQNKTSIVHYLNKRIAKDDNQTITVILWDITAFAVENENANTLLAIELSNAMNVNQSHMVMGLLTDQNGIPVDYELFPGNTSELATLAPFLNKIQKHYDIKNVIVHLPKNSTEPDRKRILTQHPDAHNEIRYADSPIPPDSALALEQMLQEIKEAFRLSHAFLESSVFVPATEQSLQAHCCIGYLALFLQRYLAFKLRENDIHLSSQDILAALSGALLMEIQSSDSEAIYCKAGMEGIFETIATTVGLGTLSSVSTATQVKKALHLQDL